MNKKIKALISSIAAIALSAGLTVGGTFALLTDEAEVNVSVTMANVEVGATIDTASVLLKTKLDDAYSSTTQFQNGGGITITDGDIALNGMAPGDYVSFDIDLTNDSNISVDYKIEMSITDTDTSDDVNLADALIATAKIGNVSYVIKEGVDTGWVKVDENFPGKITIELEFENKTDGSNNLYKGKGASVSIAVKVQQSTNN